MGTHVSITQTINEARQMRVDSEVFRGALSNLDDTIQKCFERLDQLFPVFDETLGCYLIDKGGE